MLYPKTICLWNYEKKITQNDARNIYLEKKEKKKSETEDRGPIENCSIEREECF